MDTYYLGDCLEVMDKLEADSIDAIITDPPYELNFMGKGWDNAGVSFNKETWVKCLRLLKPGGYLLAFGGSRTFHRIACAIEDAGFEIRDTIMWIYGSGFPKSMNISNVIEAKNNYKPVDSSAKQWSGWGTCLKPAFEPIIVARKPFKGSLVDNILEHGVGGLNIDECRVGNEEQAQLSKNVASGRFPANIIHDGSEEATGGMPKTKGCQGKGFKKGDYKSSAVNTSFSRGDCVPYNDFGSASRYFYCARASKRDRDEGLDEFEEKRFTTRLRNTHPTVKPTALMQYLVRLVCPKGSVILDPFMGSGSTGKATAYENKDRNAGYSFIGIGQDEQYLEIAKARIKYANRKEEE